VLEAGQLQSLAPHGPNERVHLNEAKIEEIGGVAGDVGQVSALFEVSTLL